MDLFVINRYNEDAVENTPEREAELLEKLKQKIELRKRKLKEIEKSTESQNNSFTSSNQVEQQNHDYENEKPDRKKIKVEIEHKISIENDDAKVEETTTFKPQQPENNDDNNEDNLKVLGDNVFQRKQKVDMVLPPWLAYPTIIANKITDENESIQKIIDLNYLSPEIKDALIHQKIDKLFPVQQEVIPWILNAHSKPPPFRPRDICVSAPTGSGKTLAFAIPIAQILSKRVERKIRALIILPVNELALQVYRVFKNLLYKSTLSVCLLSKTLPLAVEQQNLVEYFNGNYYSKVDIVVTTPGRLVEHLHSTKGFTLNHLKFLVIDEADRIIEQIHHNWLYHLNNHVKNTSDTLISGKQQINLCLYDLKNGGYNQPHKLLFSATLSQDPEKLQKLNLFQPKLFTSVVLDLKTLAEKFKNKSNENNNSKEIRGEFIGKYTTPAELIEKYCITESQLKPLTLFSLIKENSWKKFLCFTNSAETAHRLNFVLQELLKTDTEKIFISELSANLKPNQRTQILNDFAIGKKQGLICSDALARGIDIPDVDIVISYEMPRHIKTYIHRIGRTARAGRPGTGITLLSANEFKNFTKILSEAGKEPTEEIKVESDIETKYAKIFSNALNKLKNKLEHDKKMKMQHNNYINSKKEHISSTKVETSKLSIAEKLKIQAEEAIVKHFEKGVEVLQKRANKRIKRKQSKQSTSS